MTDLRNIYINDFYKASTNLDKILFLLQFAILAPSTHNIQPWLFKIRGNYCDIYIDQNKKLPYSDTKDRGLYISIGCCIENLIIAAKYLNSFSKLEIILKENLVARVYFNFSNNKIEKEYEGLVLSISKRLNRRGKFERKAINSDLIAKLLDVSKDYPNSSLKIIDALDIKNKITKLSVEGILDASKNSNFRNEIANQIANNFTKKKDVMPGYAFNLSLIPSYIFPTLMKKINLGSLSAMLSKQNLDSAQLVCIVNTEKDSKKDWIVAGRLSERIMLECHMLDLSTTINFAAIEVDTLYSKLQKVISTQDYPQFLFTVGYMKGKVKFTPRIDVKDRIIY